MFLSFCSDKYHGVILIPEGLIESIPEVYALLKVNFLLNIMPTSDLKTIWNFWILRVLVDLYFLKPFEAVEASESEC
jgi:hypothetical protein